MSASSVESAKGVRLRKWSSCRSDKDMFRAYQRTGGVRSGHMTAPMYGRGVRHSFEVSNAGALLLRHHHGANAHHTTD